MLQACPVPRSQVTWFWEFLFDSIVVAYQFVHHIHKSFWLSLRYIEIIEKLRRSVFSRIILFLTRGQPGNHSGFFWLVSNRSGFGGQPTLFSSSAFTHQHQAPKWKRNTWITISFVTASLQLQWTLHCKVYGDLSCPELPFQFACCFTFANRFKPSSHHCHVMHAREWSKAIEQRRGSWLLREEKIGGRM